MTIPAKLLKFPSVYIGLVSSIQTIGFIVSEAEGTVKLSVMASFIIFRLSLAHCPGGFFF